MRVLPLTRSEVLGLLLEIEDQADRLSQPDKELLIQMLGEFKDPEIGETASQESEIHLLRYEEGNAQVFFDVRGTQDLQIRDKTEREVVANTIAGGSIRARFGKHVFLGMDAHSRMTLGSSDTEQYFDLDQGKIQVAVGRSVFSDQATGYAAFQYDRLQFFAGRMYASWGNGIDEQLSLSSANEPMDMIRFNLDFKTFRFSYLHATLQGIGSARYLAGHRVDYRVNNRFQIGVYETVVYGGRGIQLAYLNPFVPYHFIEHQLGDLDNNMLGFDFSAIAVQGVRIYGELFLDDLVWNRSIFNYWANKFGYLAGIHWVSPFGLKLVEILSSYTRIDPWVYTHRDSLNIYAHYGSSIGSRIGPNADRWSVAFKVRPHLNWWGEIVFTSTRRGKGNIWIFRHPEDGTRKNFLMGTIESERRIHAHIRYQLMRDFFAGAEVMLSRWTNERRVSGQDAHETFFRIYLDINY